MTWWTHMPISCWGVALFDTNDRFHSIEHVIAPELGMVMPCVVILCGDSHTTTYGAFGTLGRPSSRLSLFTTNLANLL
jgi:homoaconitase/3-isopropylmalate dehydratase large subunit